MSDERKKQMGLFPSVALTEDELERLASPLYPLLWKMIREPFLDLKRRRTEDRAFRLLSEGQTAQWLRPQIIDRARQLTEGDETLSITEKNQQIFIKHKEEMLIVPKKLKLQDRKALVRLIPELTFSSYDTEHNRLFWGQKSIDGVPHLPRLLVGYQFVSEMTEIKIWVAYPFGKRLRTCLLMPDQNESVIGIYQPDIDIEPEDQDKGYRVKPKRDKRKPGANPEADGS